MTRLIIPNEKETTFINAYIEAIYFTDACSIDEPNENTPLDESFEREAIIDCLAFYMYQTKNNNKQRINHETI